MALDINSTLLLNLKMKSPLFLKMKSSWNDMNINHKQTEKGSAVRAIIKRQRDETTGQVSIQSWTKQEWFSQSQSQRSGSLVLSNI